MIEGFYDRLSPFYKYIFKDWDVSVDRQAAILDEIIREYFGENVRSILDAACGVGTQTIGLAQKGYRVTASDISEGEIEEARLEAARRKLDIVFYTADMRNLQGTFEKRFDLVIACDNAVPHLLSDEDIIQAFKQFFQVTSDSGGCIISVRDYEAMEHGGRRLYPRQVHDVPEGKIVVFDCWEFDGDYYDTTMYIVQDTGQPVAKTAVIRGGRYYCVPISKLEQLMRDSGFRKVITLKERYFQPLIIGLKS